MLNLLINYINPTESSLEWPSWEQLCLWKIISAQNVDIESYLPMLDGLSARRKIQTTPVSSQETSITLSILIRSRDH